MFNIEEELKKLPNQPGVYIMHDENDTIIYVGKAVSLTKRVHQYFQASHNEGIKKAQMVKQIRRFEYIVTDSELEALVLENNLIKEHRPKYNTMLRDDKTYPYIQVTLGETYPRVLFARHMKKDKSRYFGPYTSGFAVREVIDLVNKLFKLRTCSRKLPEEQGKDRPCLNHHIKQCDAPCQGYISPEAYREKINEAVKFLNGDYKSVLDDLKAKMEEASAALEFERAMEYRDLIKSVEMLKEKQKITYSDGEDKDVIGVEIDRDDAVAQVFFIRNGKLIGREHFYIKVRVDESTEQILENFIKQYYSGTPFIPRYIHIQAELKEREVIEDWLTMKRGQKATIVSPKRGQNEKLVELAKKNAEMVLSKDRDRLKREEGRTIGAMKEIGALLNLPDINRVEAYDISHISGFLSVGSMVVYEKGKPCKSDYRKFRLKTVGGPDDYASMYEVLTRRFMHGIKEREEIGNSAEEMQYGSFTRFPDIIMMDGGKGQVNVAVKVMEELKLDIPICGMVKDDYHRTRGLYYNNIEIPIEKDSEGFKLITRIQDEAHRFAIEYHRSLRSKNQVKSVLDDIKGIGPTRRKALMKAFGSIEAIAAAEVKELAEVDGMNTNAAEAVYGFFREKDSEEV
ncbi:MAG: excinuclease ABC subunit UvrC [Lachnospiraceae bacterium]|nr:excinuclease ABC subunit UvrC [Lachnospiraceae bacterium]